MHYVDVTMQVSPILIDVVQVWQMRKGCRDKHLYIYVYIYLYESWQ